MTKREMAPRWVVLGILILYLFFSVIGFLGFLDIISMNNVFFTNEYNQSVGYSYYSFWWLNCALTLLFYGWIATISIIRKWRVAAIIGSLILACSEFLYIISFLFELSSTNYYELYTYINVISPMNRFLTIFYIVGILLLIWNTRVSKSLKILISAYELLIYISKSLSPFFQDIDFNLYLMVGMPLISIVLLVIYFYNGREMKGIACDNK